MKRRLGIVGTVFLLVAIGAAIPFTVLWQRGEFMARDSANVYQNGAGSLVQKCNDAHKCVNEETAVSSLDPQIVEALEQWGGDPVMKMSILVTAGTLYANLAGTPEHKRRLIEQLASLAADAVRDLSPDSGENRKSREPSTDRHLQY